MIVISAADLSKQWSETPRQLLEIGGETLLGRLIRQVRQRTKEKLIITVPEIGYYGDLTSNGRYSLLEYVGIPGEDFAQFTSVKDIFESPTLFLYADTFITNRCMDIMIQNTDDFHFFAREQGNLLKLWGEPWGIKIPSLDPVYEIIDVDHWRKGTWELYRYMCGYPIGEHIVGLHYTEINDASEDFDVEEDYYNWLKLYGEQVYLL